MKSSFELKLGNNVSGGRNSRTLIAVGALSGVGGFIILLAAALLPGDGHEVWRAVLLGFGLTGLAGIFISKAITAHKDAQYLKVIIAKVAKSNKLRPLQESKPRFNTEYYPALKGIGSTARILAAAIGSVGNHTTKIAAYSYVERLQITTPRRLLYIQVEFDKLFPHIVLQTRSARSGVFITSLGRTFDDNQRVSLQNDLDQYFLFYTHRRTVTDALTVLSPQLLEELRKLNCTLSMETIGTSVYFYIEMPEVDAIELRSVQQFITTAVQSFERTTKTHFLKLPNDQKYPFLRSRPTGGVVAFAGRYFNYAAFFLAIQCMWNIFKVFANTESEIYPYRWWLASGAIVLTAMAILYLNIKRSDYTRTANRRGY